MRLLKDRFTHRKPNDHRSLAVSIAGGRPGARLFGTRDEEEPELDVNQEFLPILNTQYDQQGDPIHLDLSFKRWGGGVPILIVSPPRAGKTTLICGIIEEMMKRGYAVADLLDAKSDMWHTRKPLPPKFHKFLPYWRQPKALPVKPYIPYYIYKKTGKSTGMSIGQMQITDMTANDLTRSVFKFDAGKPQDQLIKKVYEKPPKDIQELRSKVANVNKISHSMNNPKDGKIFAFDRGTVDVVGRNVDQMLNSGLIGDKHKMDFVGDMVEGKFPVLSLNNYTDEEHMGYAQSMIASIGRNIFREVSSPRGRLYKKRVCLIIDDAVYAVPPVRNPSCKSVILNELISIGGVHNIFPIISTQNLSQISSTIVAQAKYIIFFKSIFGDDLKTFCKARKVNYSSMEKKFSSGLAPEKIITGQYAGARSCMIWSEDRKVQKGWIPMPSCGTHEAS